MSVNPNDLRALADWLESKPEVAERACLSTVYLFPDDTDEWYEMLRRFGTYTKDASVKFLNANRQFGGITLQAAIEKEKTCERVKVGEREVQREVYPDDVTPAIVTETEPIYEWQCPTSWMGAS